MLRKSTRVAAFAANLVLSSAAVAQQSGIRVQITAGDDVLMASLDDNATTRELVGMFPLTLPMMNRYSREMVYRFPDPLPAYETRTSGYEVGEIVYWAPRHSFVIMYAQNGEIIGDLQSLGRIDAGAKIFEGAGDMDVTFELIEE